MPVRPPSLRAVSAFEAAARHQSFSKAATELNLTHGAVSHAIRGLEERLGVRLFDRRGGGVVVTEAGRAFAGRVRLGLSLLSGAFETRPWLERSKLVISVLPSFAASVLIPRIRDFREQHPHIELELRASWSLAQLDDGEVDVGLRYGPGGWAGLSAVKLAEEQLFPVISPAYGREIPRQPKDLIGHDLIGHPEFPWGPWFAAAGLEWDEPKSALTIDESLLCIDAAALGIGIALVRSLLAESALKSGRVRKLFDIEIRSNYSYWLVWNPVSPKLEIINLFHNWLAGQLHSIGSTVTDTPMDSAIHAIPGIGK